MCQKPFATTGMRSRPYATEPLGYEQNDYPARQLKKLLKQRKPGARCHWHRAPPWAGFQVGSTHPDLTREPKRTFGRSVKSSLRCKCRLIVRLAAMTERNTELNCFLPQRACRALHGF
jgi:hypothetical protein